MISHDEIYVLEGVEGGMGQIENVGEGEESSMDEP